MIIFARASAMLLAVMPAPLLAQEAPADPMATVQESPGQASASGEGATSGQGTTQGDAASACKPKKKKGLGLGSILKAASKTGLTNMVGGGLLGGYGGAVAGTAINTGVSVAESREAKPAADGC